MNAKPPIALKVLLQHRHLQTHRAFCREYDRVATKADPTLRGSWPNKAQFYRWLAGDLIGRPYPDHRRILESMFPGWKVDQLFQTHDGGIEFAPQPAATPTIQPTRPAGQSPTMSEMLRSIEWGLEAATNRGSAGPDTREALAQHIAQSLVGLAKRLRLPDAEVIRLAKLAGHVVELDVSCSIDIDSEGWSTVTYTHQLLNLTNRPIKRLVRELWFETTNGPLVIEPSPNDDRKVTIQRTHDMNNLSNFACHISPGIPPGDVAIISYFCRGGRFVRDHYWRQAVPRYTRRLTLSIATAASTCSSTALPSRSKLTAPKCQRSRTSRVPTTMALPSSP